MEWFNVFGLVFMVAIMLPNIVFAVKSKETDENKYRNKKVECIEQIGRYGCIAFMVFNVPYTWFGWWSHGVFIAYLAVNVVLISIYIAIWIICRNKNNLFKSLSLSIIPSLIFMFSGIACRSLPLILSSLLFATAHIYISCKNAQ